MIYLILVLSFGLRLIGLNQSLWLDESIQVWASRIPLDRFFNQFLPQDFNPPGFYLITHYWIQFFGDSEIAVRMPSVILGTASLSIFYLILKKLRVTGNELLITISLLATGPLHVYYSQEARMYSLAVFSLLLVTWLFIRFLDKSSFLNTILVGFGLILMSMSHYLTLLTLPVFVGFSAYKEKIFNSKILVGFLIFGLAWLIYLPVFRSQLSFGAGIKTDTPVWHQVIGQPSLKSAGLLPVKFIIGRVNIQPKWLYGLISGALVVVYWGSAGLASIISQAKYKYLFIGLLIFPPLFGFIISFWLPVFSYFRFIYCLPFLYLLIGFSPINQKIKYSLIIINFIFTSIYLFNPGFHRENWKGLAEWLNQQNPPQVYILNQVRFPLEYYYKGKITVVQNAIENQNEVYLVSYGLPIFDQEDKIRQRLKAEDLMLKAGKSFNQVGIEVWRK